MNSPQGTPVQPPPASRATLRGIAAVALLLLLASYWIANRPIAKLGFPPFYIGEMVLALGLAAAAFNFESAVINPLKSSRALRWVCVFSVYGLARIGINVFSQGMDAARDGVICVYALFALIAPWLLGAGSPSTRARIQQLFLPASMSLALVFAGGIYLGVFAAPSEIKVDFLTLSAALAFAVWVCIALENAGRWPSLAAGGVALLALALLVVLPTRALWPAPVLVAVVILLALGFNRRRALILAVACALAAGALVVAVPRIPVLKEKVEALFDPNDAHFSTPEGQRGAHSVKWRIVFWRRCVNETIQRSPAFGLGFGTNLTDLLRGTPEWPMFEDSQNAAKYGSPNRHPHSAHVSIFTRLGVVGLALWIGVLGTVFATALRRCWRERETSWPRFWQTTTLLCMWSIYVLAMSFGVVLENPFGGIPFWVLTGLLSSPRPLQEPRT